MVIMLKHVTSWTPLPPTKNKNKKKKKRKKKKTLSERTVVLARQPSIFLVFGTVWGVAIRFWIFCRLTSSASPHCSRANVSRTDSDIGLSASEPSLSTFQKIKTNFSQTRRRTTGFPYLSIAAWAANGISGLLERDLTSVVLSDLPRGRCGSNFKRRVSNDCRHELPTKDTKCQGPLLLKLINFIPVWISNHMPSKV